ncbi:MAG: ABC transporter permease [Pseudomonadota bacterium]
MRIELTPRERIGGPLALFAPLAAIAVTALIGAAIFLFLGKPPGLALYTYFVEPLTEFWSLHELAVKAAPLILIAAGLCVCFRSNNWNIGAEGQFVAGAIAGSALPILLPEAAGWWLLPAMFAFAMAGGAGWAMIPAICKNRFGASEILVSLMLVYVATLLLDYLVRGPWRNPEGFNFPESRDFGASAVLPEILSSGAYGGRAHWGIFIAIVLAILTFVILHRTLKGFEISVGGASARAARFAGFDQRSTTLFAFLYSGALAGLAGIIEVSGAIGELRPSISPGYGFTAIIVAFLGRLHPIAVIGAGLLLALTYLGGEAAQISLGVSDEATRVFQGVLLFSVLTADTLSRYRVRLRFERWPAPSPP